MTTDRTSSPLTFERQGRALASELARLRGQFAGDPAHAAEFADALNALTAHRLLGHAYAEAASDAQEAVIWAARGLAAAGPLGPYTPVEDALRLVTASVQLATLQDAAGLGDAANQSLAPVQALREQLRGLDERLAPEVAVWLLLLRSRQALTDGDAAAANGWADLAGWRLAETSPAAGSQLAADVHRAIADARWAAGRVDESVLHGLRAVELVDEVMDAGGARPGSPAATNERLSEPAYATFTAVADRLRVRGDADLAVSLRRRLIARLEASGDHQLSEAQADLSAELRAAGRPAEEATLPAASRPMPGIQPRLDWTIPDERLGASDAGQTGFAAELAALGPKAERWWADAQASEADYRRQAEVRGRQRDQERAEQERRAAEAAERARRNAERAAEQAVAEEAAAQDRAAQERVEAQRQRAARMAEYQAEAERREIERLAAQRSDTKRRSDQG